MVPLIETERHTRGTNSVLAPPFFRRPLVKFFERCQQHSLTNSRKQFANGTQESGASYCRIRETKHHQLGIGFAKLDDGLVQVRSPVQVIGKRVTVWVAELAEIIVVLLGDLVLLSIWKIFVEYRSFPSFL